MSAIHCHDIVREHLSALDRGFTCGESGGRIWIVTPYTQPDGGNIEVNVLPRVSGRLIVTDLGETMRNLANFGFDPRSTLKGQYLIEEILKSHHVTMDRSMITKEASPSEVGDAVRDVVVASLKMANLIYLSRTYRPATFTEEVAQFLAEQQVDFEPKVQRIAENGKKYTISFLIRDKGQERLLQTISPTNPGAMTQSINATVRMWVDIGDGPWRGTLVNDTMVPVREADIGSLARVSHVFKWSQRTNGFLRAVKDPRQGQ